MEKIRMPQETSRTNIPRSSEVILIEESLTFEEVVVVVEKFIPNSTTALKLVLAVGLSAHTSIAVMLWLVIVSPPSSGKSDLVRLIKHAPSTYSLDTFTQNSFISGERVRGNEKVYDLLNELDKKVLIIKDWTPLFSMDEKATRKIIGDLVGIYDKEFSKFSGSRGLISTKSIFSHLGAITPATLSKHTQYLNTVGPRFLFYTLPDISSTEEEAGFVSIFSGRDREALEHTAQLHASSYLHQLTQKKDIDVDIPSHVRQYIEIAAKFLSRCRGITIPNSVVYRDNSGYERKDWEYGDAQIEQPWRATLQLIELAKNLAIVSGKSIVGRDELSIVRGVVLSSMPFDRAKAVRAFSEHGGVLDKNILSSYYAKSQKTMYRLLKELSHLGIAEESKNSGSQPSTYKVVDTFYNFLVLDAADFLSNNYKLGGSLVNTDITPIDELNEEQQLQVVQSVFGEESKWSE